MKTRNLDCMESNLTPRQVELYNLLRRLWVEHVMWTRSFIISTAFNLGDLDVVTKRLLQNPTDFAYLLSMFYGNQGAMQFENLFTEHLNIGAELVNAAKARDTKTADELRAKWQKNADEVASFLAEINSYWNKDAWQDILYEHLEMTENQAAQILTGQYQAGIDQYASIESQALMMADLMACGIIKQFNL